MSSKIKRNAIVHLACVMWRYATGQRGWVVLYVAMAGLAILVGLLGPYIMAQLLNTVQKLSGSELMAQSRHSLALVLGVGVLFWVFHGPSRVMETVIAFKVKRAIQADLLKKIMRLPMNWHVQHHSGATIDQVNKACTALGEFTEGGFEIIHLLTRLIGAIAILTWIMPAAGLVAMGLSGVAVLVIVLFDRWLIVQYNVLNRSYNHVAAAIQDCLSNVKTVLSLRMEDLVTKEVDQRTSQILPVVYKTSVVNELKWFSNGRVIDLTYVIVLLLYISKSAKTGQVVEIGTLYAVSEYLRAVGDSFFQFSARYSDLVIKSERVRAAEHIEEAYAREDKSNQAAAAPAKWRRISIENLCFTHFEEKQGNRRGLNRVSFELERGKNYALFGSSGSGKSTLMALLRGLYQSAQVRVVVDGVVCPYGLAHVANCTTLIPQRSEIFAETIRYNVCMGINASERAIYKAIEMAQFEAVLARLPRGLETHTAERGANLSGGQQQRLALARGLYFAEASDSHLILLDESTNSLDMATERAIFQELFEKFAGRCIISATHNLELLPLFDEILVFEEGRLVENGSLEDLLSVNGHLAKLWGKFYREQVDSQRVIS